MAVICNGVLDHQEQRRFERSVGTCSEHVRSENFRKSFRRNSSKKKDFSHRSHSMARPGELRAVRIRGYRVGGRGRGSRVFGWATAAVKTKSAILQKKQKRHNLTNMEQIRQNKKTVDFWRSCAKRTSPSKSTSKATRIDLLSGRTIENR